jgi:hypothetical protein
MMFKCHSKTVEGESIFSDRGGFEDEKLFCNSADLSCLCVMG